MYQPSASSRRNFLAEVALAWRETPAEDVSPQQRGGLEEAFGLLEQATDLLDGLVGDPSPP